MRFPVLRGSASRQLSARHLQALVARLQRTSPRVVWTSAGLAAGATVVVGVIALAWPILSRILLLCATSVLLAYLVAPLVETVRRRLSFDPIRQIPRAVAILIVYAVLGGTMYTTWRLVAPRFERQMANLSFEARRAVRGTVSRVRAIERSSLRLGLPGAAGETTADVVIGLTHQVEAEAEAVLREIAEHMPFLRWLWLTPILAFFLLRDWKRFRLTAVRVLPEGHLRWRGDELLGHVNSVLAGYTRAQLLSCLVIGSLCAAGFAVLRLPYPLALGALAGVLEFLPLVGPLSVALVAASFASGTRLLLVLGFLLGLRLVQDYIIYPRLAGRRMHLHPLAIVLAVLVGARVGGLVGVFCAVPIVGIISVGVRHYREWRQIQDLIAEYDAEFAAVAVSESAAPAAADATALTASGTETDRPNGPYGRGMTS